MTTANDLIAALNQRRLLKAGRADDIGRMPPGWQRWFDGMERVDAVAMQARPGSWIRVFLERPLRAKPRRSQALGRLQALSSLLQQNWEADDKDDRGLRIGAGALDIVMHLLLVGLLLWLMYLGFLALRQAPEEEGEAVQVEFIGRGNVAEGGGALANEGADSAPAAAAPSSESSPSPGSGATDAAISRVEVPVPPRVAASSESSELEDTVPALAEPAAAQPLQVTEVPAAEPEAFQLPPPRERQVQMQVPQLREPQRVQQVEEIATLRTRPMRTLQPTERSAELKVPELRERTQAIETFRPNPDVLTRERAMPDASQRQSQVQMPQLRGQQRDIPLRPGGSPAPSSQAGSGTASNAAANNTGAGGEQGSAPAAGQAQAGAGAGNRVAAESGRGVASSGAGAGSADRPAPGGWQGAAKSDDWGAASRNSPGTGVGNGRNGSGTSGLFNADGGVRLPDDWSQQSGVNTDREGTWLKRPGLEYRGTRFDRIWVPQGTLLEEWVRRGIKKIAIPIPGTDSRLECVVSLLQLGGGCFPVDANVNEQPARARKSPDVPFVPELQEDNGSVKPPEGG